MLIIIALIGVGCVGAVWLATRESLVKVRIPVRVEDEPTRRR